METKRVCGRPVWPFLAILLITISTLMAQSAIELSPIGRFASGVFDEGAAEIVAYDPGTQRLFVSNGNDATIDILDMSDPGDLAYLGSIDLGSYGEAPTHVAVHDGLVAVAVEADPKTDPGSVVFFDSVSRQFLASVQVGALPDMVLFTPDGNYVLTADEGEPSSYCSDGIDPEGSISVIDISGGAGSLTQQDVRIADFQWFNNFWLGGLRVFGPNATVAQDLEPEYIAVSDDSRIAWVTLQENNGIAVVDIQSALVLAVLPLGTIDHSAPGYGLDASDRDGQINIASWPVKGMFMPDAIAAYEVNPRSRARRAGRGPFGANFFRTFLVTANEGDAREYFCLFDPDQTEAEAEAAGDEDAEDERVKGLELDPVVFPDAASLQEDENLGRLNVTLFNGDSDGLPGYEELFSFGTRSFSIWSATGQLIWDSGDDFERIIAVRHPTVFNSDNDENDSFDSRSDAKGPEPEGIVVGGVGGRTYAFIGLERIGGIMIYDVSNPFRPFFVDYVNTRDFDADLGADDENELTETDLAPEGLLFIPEQESPNGKPLLVVAYEVSGSTVVYEINHR